MTLFIQAQKQKKLSIKMTLMMYFNQSILQFYAGLLIQSFIIILLFQSIIL